MKYNKSATPFILRYKLQSLTTSVKLHHFSFVTFISPILLPKLKDLYVIVPFGHVRLPLFEIHVTVFFSIYSAKIYSSGHISLLPLLCRLL